MSTTPEALREQFGNFTQSALEKSKEIYEEAQEWVPENTGTILALGSAAAVIAATGYWIGKSRRISASVPEPVKEADVSSPDFDLKPVFKLLKLWMLYRAAV